jgi:hypothetical protein
MMAVAVPLPPTTDYEIGPRAYEAAHYRSPCGLTWLFMRCGLLCTQANRNQNSTSYRLRRSPLAVLPTAR